MNCSNMSSDMFPNDFHHVTRKIDVSRLSRIFRKFQRIRENSRWFCPVIDWDGDRYITKNCIISCSNACAHTKILKEFVLFFLEISKTVSSGIPDFHRTEFFLSLSLLARFNTKSWRLRCKNKPKILIRLSAGPSRIFRDFEDLTLVRNDKRFLKNCWISFNWCTRQV